MGGTSLGLSFAPMRGIAGCVDTAHDHDPVLHHRVDDRIHETTNTGTAKLAINFLVLQRITLKPIQGGVESTHETWRRYLALVGIPACCLEHLQPRARLDAERPAHPNLDQSSARTSSQDRPLLGFAWYSAKRRLSSSICSGVSGTSASSRLFQRSPINSRRSAGSSCNA